MKSTKTDLVLVIDNVPNSHNDAIPILSGLCVQEYIGNYVDQDQIIIICLTTCKNMVHLLDTYI